MRLYFQIVMTETLFENGNGNGSAPSPAGPILLRELSDGDEVCGAFVVRERERRQKRNGEHYLRIVLADKTGDGPGGRLGRRRRVLRGLRAGLRRPGQRELRDPSPVRPADQACRRAPRRPRRVRPPSSWPRGRRGPIDLLEADLRELIATVQSPALRELLDRFFARRHRVLGALPRGARRQALPPGLRRRTARAQPVGRPGGERGSQLLPRHRPRDRGHWSDAPRHRQDRGLQRRPARDRADRRRPPRG